MAAIASDVALTPLEPETPYPVADNDGTPVDETPGRWFVELSSAPLSDRGSAAMLANEKQTFRNAARGAGVKYIENYAYDSLFNGFSVTVSRAQLSTIARLPGVKAIYPVDTIPMPQSVPDPTSSPELYTALQMTGADVAQNSLGLDGTGIRVAVMDTGIDIDHPAFGGGGVNGGTAFPSARIVAGWDFVGDAFDQGTNPVPVPDARPDDCAGHGTHVAGIIGANGQVKGVAPKVSFGAYRVFGCAGSTSSDIMLAAMERAQADRMQVLNMSIGAALQWPQYPTAQAATRLVNQGMIVVASAGNDAALGLYGSSAPSVGEKVISVASFDNIGIAQPAFAISPDAMKIGYNAATGAPAPPSSGTTPIARTGTTSSTADACAALPAGSLTGKIALIRRGTCSFYIKAKNAEAAGAAGVLLYNNVAGGLNPTVAGTPSVNIPTVGISQADGATIDGRVVGSGTSLTWGPFHVSQPNPTGGLISSFSSWGLSPDLTLKPDIGAPGGSIYSTYPLELGGYASLSGTSMSSPHVAGAAALLLQALPHTPSQAVRSILQNTAQPALWSGNPGLGFLEPTHRQGAGMLHIDRAIVNATRLDPGKISLGEGQAGPQTRTLTFTNGGSTPVTYTLSSVNSLATGPNTFSLSFYNAGGGVAFSAPSVVVPAHGSATVNATITPFPTGGGLDGGIYGGYLVATPNDGSNTLRIPFSGYVGDYQARQVLVPTANGFPWLAKFNGSSYFNQPSGASYTMIGNDIPFFLIHFDHQAAGVRMDVRNADTNRSAGKFLQTDYFGRNSSATGFFAFSWDGNTTQGRTTGPVPNGRYTVLLQVLKANGDPNNPAHWETWASPVVTIAR
ncbi:S8 family serine peptidase [Cognatilysobacter terrigena]|uniref:S8 family serine peptidase n=1 Tax=Cognatilysobacter terrigena TaxID=2488749 RepID=UPI00105CFAF9|nr:S8 family serine peptidase [Lysobacter terrigena]